MSELTGERKVGWMDRWMMSWYMGLNLWLVSGELEPTLGPGLVLSLCSEAVKVESCQWPAWITASSLFLGSGSCHLLCEIPPGALAAYYPWSSECYPLITQFLLSLPTHGSSVLRTSPPSGLTFLFAARPHRPWQVLQHIVSANMTHSIWDILEHHVITIWERHSQKWEWQPPPSLKGSRKSVLSPMLGFYILHRTAEVKGSASTR